MSFEMSDSHDPVSRRCLSGASPVWQVWIIRAASLVGFLLAGYLFYQAMIGAGVAGCGEEASCAEVLASRWSKIGPIPVSGPAALVYLVILFYAGFLGPKSAPGRRISAWRMVVFFGCAAALAALWFIGLQLFVVGKVCTYCMAAHACSLLIGAVAFAHGPRRIPFFAVAGVGVMILGQVLIPPPPPDAIEGEMRFMFNPQVEPTLGDPGSDAVVGFLFDYNCGHCAEVHRQLHEAIERYDGQVAVVMLPTAISPACNPYVRNVNPVFEQSCAMARLALAVYHADAAQFAGFDAFIMEQLPRVRRDGMVPEGFVNEVLRPEAARRVGEEALAASLDSPWVNSRLTTSAEVYHRTPNPHTGKPAVPRLIVAGQPYPATTTEAALFKLLEDAYPQLRPVKE